MNAISRKETVNPVKGLLNDTLKEIMSVLNAECGSLFLFDSEEKELILDSFYNSNSLRLEGIRQRIGEGISGKVADIKIPVLVEDIDLDSRFKRNGFKHYRTDSFISIPLYISNNLLGVINIADKSTGNPFSQKDLEFVSTLAKYVCLIVDNLLDSGRLKQEKESLDKQKLLLEKYASVGKLAAGVVHEINNPLDGIIRYTNILLIQLENNPIVREYLLEIKKGLIRINGITKSLLEFSHQVNSNALQIKNYVDVNKLIDESLGIFEDRINGGIKIEKRYQNNLPKILDLGISHAFINIIKNALDAMSQEGRLMISVGLRDSLIEISFKDTGLGIPSEIKERIFEPFFTTKDRGKGTGLGLAICHEIINRYAGKIEVESVQGQGTTFTILIPKKYLENA